MATPLYVDPAAADDTGDGTTPATAKKTIAAAYAAVDSGGFVYLLAGTYDDTTQGANWLVNFDGARSATIKPDPATSPAITLVPKDATRSIYFSQASAAYTHRLEGVTVTPLNGARLAESAATCLGIQELVNCTFPSSAQNIYGASQTAATRTFRVQGCTITSSSANLIDVRGAAYIHVDSNTITHTGTAATVRVSSNTTKVVVEDNTIAEGGETLEVVAASTFTDCIVRGNEITVTPAADNNCLRFREDVTTAGSISIIENEITVAASAYTYHALRIGESTIDPATTTYYNARIIGNTMIQNDINIAYGIILGVGCEMAEVAYNYLTGWDSAVYLVGNRNVIDTNYMNCTNGVRALGGSESKCVHNHIVSNNNGGSGRCIVWGRLVKAASTSTTTYAEKTVTDGGASAWGGKQANIVAGLIAMVGAEATPTHWARVVSITGDAVTIDSWKKYDAAATVETPSNSTVCNIVLFPRKNVTTDNLMDGSLADNTITYDFDPDDPNLYQDRNVFVVGIQSLTNLGTRFGDVATDLAGFQSRWAEISPLFPYNDANSKVQSVVPSRYNTYARWWGMPTWYPHGKIRPGLLIPI